jgi:hypothetical protein
MQVRDEEETFEFLLHLNPVLERPYQVSQMKLARRLDTA